jgi:hypothetical protein
MSEADPPEPPWILEIHGESEHEGVWIAKSKFDAMERAFEMAVEALEIIADERGIDDPMFRQFSAMCRIVARSSRKMAEGE